MYGRSPPYIEEASIDQIRQQWPGFVQTGGVLGWVMLEMSAAGPTFIFVPRGTQHALRWPESFMVTMVW